jgi:hypothetical protein
VRQITFRRTTLAAVTALVVVLAMPSRAGAQGFVSPLIGYDFGGDSGCASATGCEEKKLNLGVSAGVIGKIFGFEEEFAYAKDFFGKVPGQTNNVLTLMSNFMVIPAIGPAHPYVLGGLGMMKAHADLSPSTLLDTDNTTLAWNVGGGAMVLFGHVGVRGDLRHVHSFKDTSLLGFSFNGTKLDFSRLSGALVLAF